MEISIRKVHIFLLPLPIDEKSAYFYSNRGYVEYVRAHYGR